MIVIWDNLNTHRSQKMRAFTQAREDWLTMVALPGYAPDLNAVEGAWSVMKSGLGNHAAATLDQLEALVRSRLRAIQRRPDLINALPGQTGLTLDRHRRPWPFNLCKPQRPRFPTESSLVKSSRPLDRCHAQCRVSASGASNGL